jgi:hypothetical protein
MKNLGVLVMVFALCLPAGAEVLVFQTSTSGQQLDIPNQVVSKKSDRGYLVLDVDMSNLASIIVNEAYHLTYGKTAGAKTQSTIILDPQNVEMILAANNGSSVKMVLRWFDNPTGTYTVVSGSAKSTDIGGIQQTIAKSATGSSVWRLLDYMTGSSSISLKLDATDTKLANTQNQMALDVLESLSQLLESKGYRADL